MELNDIKAAYFVGIGGIGMSALARYFLAKGVYVAGYDRTPSDLTHALEREGAAIHYEEDASLIPTPCLDRATTLVVYTPAVPNTHAELAYFRRHGFETEKRAQVLGKLTRTLKALCVAGTHGKTTTSAMAAHILNQSHIGCNAFLGGITKNYGTNYILAPQSPYVVIEADEYDRSFHHLTPYATVITAVDADHLDIYGTHQAYIESFEHYTSLITPGGTLIIHTGLAMHPKTHPNVKTYTYSETTGDFHAHNIHIANQQITFDLTSPLGNINNIQLGVPIRINIENAIAAIALTLLAGAQPQDIKNAMTTYTGVLRRFDIKLNTPHTILITDYAHHPTEISTSIQSIRQLYPNKTICAIFQPHLYTRTRDLYQAFAQSLEEADEIILTPIYPARETPIPHITSQLIYNQLPIHTKKTLLKKTQDLPQATTQSQADIFLLLGAGDINQYATQITETLKKRK